MNLVEGLSIFGADRSPDTLTGSCTGNPGLACRVIWDVFHNGQAASLTSEFFAGPVQLLLKLAFVVLLALVILALVRRVISRITARAEQSLLPQLRGNGNGQRAAAGRMRRRLVRRPRRSPVDDSLADDAAAARAAGGAGIPATSAAPPDPAPVDDNPAEAAVRAESAVVDERRKQRVRALGAVLNSVASIIIFAIAGFIILGDIGINLAPLLASAGVVGVAVGFGAQSLVRDYLSGIFMLVEDQYGVGDVVTVGTATGTVENVTLRLTRLRDVNGIVWHIRNGAIETVGNESQGWARAVIDFPVPFSADLGVIRDLLVLVGDELWNDPGWRPVMLEAPEVWGAQAISSTEVTMRMVAKTAPLRQWEVEREIRARVKRALADARIMPVPVEPPTLAVTLTGDK